MGYHIFFTMVLHRYHILKITFIKEKAPQLFGSFLDVISRWLLRFSAYMYDPVSCSLFFLQQGVILTPSIYDLQVLVDSFARVPEISFIRSHYTPISVLA